MVSEHIVRGGTCNGTFDINLISGLQINDIICHYHYGREDGCVRVVSCYYMERGIKY